MEKEMEQPAVNVEEIQQEYQKIVKFMGSHDKFQDLREKARKCLNPTPRELLYREHSVSLYYYPPKEGVEAKVQRPLLVVPSLVNKPCIMDLFEGESFITGMLERGVAVYMLEWGEPTPGQKKSSLYQYLKQYLGRAVRRTRRHAGSDKVYLAGYCLGGTLSVLYSALDRGKQIAGLCTMVTPLNFHDKGLLSWWAKEEHFDVDKIVDSYGNIPADFFASSFPWLVPTASIKKAKTLMNKQEDEAFLINFLALDIWLTENIDFPGEVYREVIKKGYQKNVLTNEKSWKFEEEEARLSDINFPVLNMVAQYDHVSPADSCAVLEDLLDNANVETASYPGGHLSFALGRDVRNKHTSVYWDKIAGWLESID